MKRPAAPQKRDLPQARGIKHYKFGLKIEDSGRTM